MPGSTLAHDSAARQHIADVQPPAGVSLRQRFGNVMRSWMAMKTWVKLWLFFLNVVLFAAAAFLHDPLGVVTLASLPVVLVLLLALALPMGGLNRLVGLGHLIPWVPLLVYLDLRLLSGLAGPRIDPGTEPALFAWAVVLGAALSICLALDVWDVVRWWRGERYILGSEAAFAAGASNRAPEPRGRRNP